MSRENRMQVWFAGGPAYLLDVREFSVREHMNGLWVVDVIAVGSFGNLALDSFVDQGAAFTLERSPRIGRPDPRARVWSGVCWQFAHLSEQPDGVSLYSIRIMPEFARASLRRNSRTFQHLNGPKIALRILKDWGISEEKKNLLLRNLDIDDEDRFPKAEFYVQYEETDYAFFCRVLEEAGISFYFRYLNVKARDAALQGTAEAFGSELTALVLDADPQIAEEEPNEIDEGNAVAGEIQPQLHDFGEALDPLMESGLITDASTDPVAAAHDIRGRYERGELTPEQVAAIEGLKPSFDALIASMEASTAAHGLTPDRMAAVSDWATAHAQSSDAHVRLRPGPEKEEPNAKRVIGPLPYLGEKATTEFGRQEDVVLNAGYVRTVRPGAVTILDHDFRHKAWEPPGRPKQHVSAEGASEAKYEVLAFVPARLHGEKTPTEGNESFIDPGGSVAKDALRALRIDSSLITFQTNALHVAPGAVVGFGGAKYGEFVGDEHSRSELAGDKRHLVVETLMRGDTGLEWFVSCTAVPADPLQPYRPAEDTPKPQIFGIQTALVVGPKSAEQEQIYCDKYGRVRIQFHWDRQHKYGEAAEGLDDVLGSCWVRVATPSAGARYGFVAVPRVGHEVCVSFVDGNPNLPMIVGSLYNGENMPPWDLPANKTITGIKTNSSPGGGGYNEMHMDDAKGSESFVFQAQQNWNQVVKAAETHSVGGSRVTKIGTDDTLHVGTQFKLAVGQRETGIHVHENTLIVLQVNGSEGAQIMLSGASVYMNAKSDIHLHAGADIHMSAEGAVKIDGGVVRVNEGRPESVELVGYAKAEHPAPGGTLRAGAKPEGGGGMPEAPGALVADIHFKPAEAEEEDGDEDGDEAEDDADEGDEAGPEGESMSTGGGASDRGGLPGASPSAPMPPAPAAPGGMPAMNPALQRGAVAALASGASSMIQGQGFAKGALSGALGQAAALAAPGGQVAQAAAGIGAQAAAAALTGGNVRGALVNAVAGQAAASITQAAGPGAGIAATAALSVAEGQDPAKVAANLAVGAVAQQAQPPRAAPPAAAPPAPAPPPRKPPEGGGASG